MENTLRQCVATQNVADKPTHSEEEPIIVDIDDDGGPLPQKPGVLVDQSGTFENKGELELRHGRHLVQVHQDGWIFCYHSEICRHRKSAEPCMEYLAEIYCDFYALNVLTSLDGNCRGQMKSEVSLWLKVYVSFAEWRFIKERHWCVWFNHLKLKYNNLNYPLARFVNW